MAHPYASYWNRGIDAVPIMTGAQAVLDANDLKGIAAELGIALPLRKVLDVGCGTGRAAKVCNGYYYGVDISQDAVAYCRRAGLSVALVEDERDLPAGPYDWIVCLSVMTHVDRGERQRLLSAFASRAPKLLVDILPGDGNGNVERWTADPVEFFEDVKRAGYQVKKFTARTSDQANHHVYHYAVRP